MSRTISARTVVAGVVGAPVRHSLSPLIHNAWLEAAGIDGVYVAFAPPEAGFRAFVEGMRGGAIRGLNVTLPFKEAALSLADEISGPAQASGAANVLTFASDGFIRAHNTDGLGLLGALAAQIPDFVPEKGPAVILGAGGAARSAAAVFAAVGAPVRIVNRTPARARAVAEALGGDVAVYDFAEIERALEGANVVVNATSAGLTGGEGLHVPLKASSGTAVMDMTYVPLETPLLAQARRLGLPTADGLEMLIRQAVPSFAAFYGRTPPEDVDVRALVLAELERRA